MRFIITAGGTGGHVIPALSVASQLQSLGHEVIWVGTPQGIENKLVPAARITLHTIDIKGVRGKSKRALLTLPWRLWQSLKKAWQILSASKPDAVLGFGGFASFPCAFAAFFKGIPLIIHEQNAVMGTANKILQILAKKVLLAFPLKNYCASKTRVVGNPVRAEIIALGEKPAEKIQQPLHLLITGGSQGARIFNETLPVLLSQWRDHPFEIHLQTGANLFETTKALCDKLAIPNLKITPFIDDMAKAMNWADLVLCRAGAMTVFEIAAARKAALFVPFPYAIADHQSHNAKFLANAEAAVLIPQDENFTEKLLQTLKALSDNPEQIQRLANRARSLAPLQATAEIVNTTLEVVRGR